MPSDPIGPPIQPCNVIDPDKTLLKHGLNAFALNWLSMRPNLKRLPDHAVYTCTPTRTLVLNAWEGDVTVNASTSIVGGTLLLPCSTP